MPVSAHTRAHQQFAVARAKFVEAHHQQHQALARLLLGDAVIAQLQSDAVAMARIAEEFELRSAVERRQVLERRDCRQSGGRQHAVEVRVMRVGLHRILRAQRASDDVVGEQRRRNRAAIAAVVLVVLGQVSRLLVHDRLGEAAHGARFHRIAGQVGFGRYADVGFHLVGQKHLHSPFALQISNSIKIPTSDAIVNRTSHCWGLLVFSAISDGTQS